MKYHKITLEDWEKLSIVEQMANVGSEVSRTINWKGRSKRDVELSFARAIELLQLTMKDPKNILRLRETARVKETLGDWFINGGLYNISDKDWQKYFLEYAFAARIDK